MQCSDCHAVFPDRKRLSNHMRVHRRDDGDALTHPQKKLKGLLTLVIIMLLYSSILFLCGYIISFYNNIIHHLDRSYNKGSPERRSVNFVDLSHIVTTLISIILILNILFPYFKHSFPLLFT